MEPQALVTSLARRLAELPTPGDWPRGGKARTLIMKGRVGQDSVLSRVLKDDLGYQPYEHKSNAGKPRLFLREQNRADLVAIECPENWDHDCHQGRYRVRLALELENNLQEFELHMRGLLDHRADLHCGIFFVPDDADLEKVRVGVANRDKRIPTGEQTKELHLWRPPWDESRGDWAVKAFGDERLLAVFLSGARPWLVGAKLYRPGQEDMRITPR